MLVKERLTENGATSSLTTKSTEFYQLLSIYGISVGRIFNEFRRHVYMLTSRISAIMCPVIISVGDLNSEIKINRIKNKYIGRCVKHKIILHPFTKNSPRIHN